MTSASSWRRARHLTWRPRRLHQTTTHHVIAVTSLAPHDLLTSRVTHAHAHFNAAFPAGVSPALWTSVARTPVPWYSHAFPRSDSHMLSADWHLNCAVLVSRIKMHTLPLVMRCYQVLRRCSEFVLHRRSLCFFQSAQTSKAFAWLPVSPGTSIFVLSAFCHSHKQYAHDAYTERQKKEPIFFCAHLFSTT